MSILLMTQAFSAEIKNPTAKLILLKLADNANDNGYCFPSIDYIAKQCSVHPRTVKRQIKVLAELGFLEVKTRFNNNKQRSNEYLIHLGRPIKSGGDILPPHKDPQEPTTSNKEQIRGDTRSPIGVTEDHPESLDLSNRIEKDLKLCPSVDVLKISAVNLNFEILWDVWPNTKQKQVAKTAFKSVLRKEKIKSPDSIIIFANKIKGDIEERLRLTANVFDDGLRNQLFATYINKGIWNQELPSKPENIANTDDAKKANYDKSKELFIDRFKK